MEYMYALERGMLHGAYAMKRQIIIVNMFLLIQSTLNQKYILILNQKNTSKQLKKKIVGKLF